MHERSSIVDGTGTEPLDRTFYGGLISGIPLYHRQLNSR